MTREKVSFDAVCFPLVLLDKKNKKKIYSFFIKYQKYFISCVENIINSLVLRTCEITDIFIIFEIYLVFTSKMLISSISLGSKVKLMRTLVISIFLYACESWTLTAELEKRAQAFEMRCNRRLLNISYKDILSMRRFPGRSKSHWRIC